MTRLISELSEEVNYLTEERDGKKSLFIEGRFLVGNEKNKNGRIYPMSILEREVARHQRDLIANGRAMGELGHPNNPGLTLERISHLVTECRRDGNAFVGKAKILNTPMGQIAEGLIQGGAKLGVSSRGMGSLKEDRKVGAMIVQEDFNLAVMIDIVADPSAPGAWVNGIMENVEWVRDAQGEWQQTRIEEIRAIVHSTPAELLPEVKSRIFETYVEDIIEASIASTLAKHADISNSDASGIVKRAKIKARLQGKAADPRFVWTAAKEILGNR